MDPWVEDALKGLDGYDLLGPFAVVEALTRLERIAWAAFVTALTREELEVAARAAMAQFWVEDGLPPPFLKQRRAEVLLRLDTMLEQFQRVRPYTVDEVLDALSAEADDSRR